VNFSNVTEHEVDVAGTGTGSYSCNPFSTRHCHAGVGLPCGNITMSHTVVPGMGTRANGIDCLFSSSCGGSAPFGPGSITIAIPYEYRVGTGPFRRFTTVTQRHVVMPDGSTLITTKAGATGITTVTSPTVAATLPCH